MLDVLNHSADYNVVLSKLRIFHGFKDNVFPIDWFSCGLAQVQPITTVDIVPSIVQLLSYVVEVGGNHVSFLVVKRLETFVVLLIEEILFKHPISVIHIISNNIAIIPITIILGKWFWKLVVAWV